MAACVKIAGIGVPKGQISFVKSTSVFSGRSLSTLLYAQSYVISVTNSVIKLAQKSKLYICIYRITRNIELVILRIIYSTLHWELLYFVLISLPFSWYWIKQDSKSPSVTFNPLSQGKAFVLP
jgi:hypothetical protein